ncbi:MAG TPA: T9SS type A sorting domain-containing protein [Bacteroidales bacterium]|nr:T9SS type A sorting domain-containing protein [Bacteroidales bacterium]
MKTRLTLIAAVLFVMSSALSAQTNPAGMHKPGSRKTMKNPVMRHADPSKPGMVNVLSIGNKPARMGNLRSAGVIRQRLDSLIWQGWDDLQNEWIAYDREEYSYDAAGRNTRYIDSEWDDTAGEWIGYMKSDYSYNAAGDMTEEIQWDWNYEFSQWVKSLKYENTYTAGHDILLVTESYWEESSQEWAPEDKYDYTYGSNGKVSLIMRYYWDSGSEQWFLYNKVGYTYNGSGQLLQELGYYWDDGAGIWVEFDKVEYEYYGNGFIETVTYLTWNEATSSWIPWWKDEFTPDASGNVDEMAEYYWDEDAGEWIGSYLDKYSYNSAYAFDDLILPYLVGDMAFDQFVHMPVLIDEQTWDEVSGAWVDSDKGTFYYSPQDITTIPHVTSSTLQLFPNPAGESLTISWPEGNHEATLTLYNLTGRMVMSCEVGNNERLDVSGLRSGSYYYILLTHNSTYSGKVIKSGDTHH